MDAEIITINIRKELVTEKIKNDKKWLFIYKFFQFLLVVLSSIFKMK